MRNCVDPETLKEGDAVILNTQCFDIHTRSVAIPKGTRGVVGAREIIGGSRWEVTFVNGVKRQYVHYSILSRPSPLILLAECATDDE